MENQNNSAGVASAKDAEGENTSGVSTQNENHSDATDTASDGANTHQENASESNGEKKEEQNDNDTEENKDGEEKEVGDEESSDEESSEEEDSENTPFHKHPAWQRQQRKIKSLESSMKEKDEVIDKMLEKLSSAFGDDVDVSDVKQESKSEEGESVSPQEVFDDEIEGLQQSLSEEGKELSTRDQKKIQEIAQKYSNTVDGQEYWLDANVAYRIYQDMQQTEKQSNQNKPSTKPSHGQSSSASDMPADIYKQGMSPSEVAAQARKHLK